MQRLSKSFYGGARGSCLSRTTQCGPLLLFQRESINLANLPCRGVIARYVFQSPDSQARHLSWRGELSARARCGMCAGAGSSRDAAERGEADLLKARADARAEREERLRQKLEAMAKRRSRLVNAMDFFARMHMPELAEYEPLNDEEARPKSSLTVRWGSVLAIQQTTSDPTVQAHARAAEGGSSTACDGGQSSQFTNHFGSDGPCSPPEPPEGGRLDGDKVILRENSQAPHGTNDRIGGNALSKKCTRLQPRDSHGHFPCGTTQTRGMHNDCDKGAISPAKRDTHYENRADFFSHATVPLPDFTALGNHAPSLDRASRPAHHPPRKVRHR